MEEYKIIGTIDEVKAHTITAINDDKFYEKKVYSFTIANENKCTLGKEEYNIMIRNKIKRSKENILDAKLYKDLDIEYDYEKYECEVFKAKIDDLKPEFTIEAEMEKDDRVGLERLIKGKLKRIIFI